MSESVAPWEAELPFLPRTWDPRPAGEGTPTPQPMSEVSSRGIRVHWAALPSSSAESFGLLAKSPNLSEPKFPTCESSSED